SSRRGCHQYRAQFPHRHRGHRQRPPRGFDRPLRCDGDHAAGGGGAAHHRRHRKEPAAHSDRRRRALHGSAATAPARELLVDHGQETREADDGGKEGVRPDAETHTVLPSISERVPYPNSQDLGLATGLPSAANRAPLTIRMTDQMNHQTRIGMPISTSESGMPMTLYSSPIQNVRTRNRKCDASHGSASSSFTCAMTTPISAVTMVKSPRP